MNTRIKKVLALVLSVVMLFSMQVLPSAIGASAAEKTAADDSLRPGDAKEAAFADAIGDAEPLDADFGVKEDVASDDDGLALAPTGEEEEESAPLPAYIEGEAFVNFKGEFNFDGFDERIIVDETKTFAKGTAIERNYAKVHSDSMTTEEIIESFKDNEYVDYVTPNTLSQATAVTNDPYVSYQWALDNVGNNNGTAGIDTNPDNLWKKITSSSKECVVAVIDTGVDVNHEDLKNVLWKNTYKQLEGYGSCGYDFSGTVSSGVPRDDDGHGTHIAGIIAAQANNSIGISGINKANVKIMALRVEKEEYIDGEYYEYYDDEAISNAFDYIIRAKKLGVNIVAVNCSYGGPYTKSEIDEFTALSDELGKMGIITCVAAGNESVNIDKRYYWDSQNGGYVYYDGNGPYYVGPAATTSKYAITVGAGAEDGYLAGFSNYGQNVDISAPGASILSTVNTNTFQPSIYNSTTRSKTCMYYQSFDSTNIGDNDLFGTIWTYNSYNKPSLGINENRYFGTSGSSLQVSSGSYRKGKIVLFSIPLNINSSTAAYDITFSVLGTKPDWNTDVEFYVLDKPEANGALDAAQLCGFSPTYDWYTVHLHVDPYKTADYQRTTVRELVFALVPKTNDNCTVFIDSFGVSKQNIDTSLYGKYDYYQGTSMACPYVAGAVALVAGAYPNSSATERINAIYKSAARFDQLEDEVKDKKFLDLRNVSISTKGYYVGDVNADGQVKNRDALILDRYIAGWKNYENEIKNRDAADLNRDGQIKNRDALLLDRYIAGWKGFEKYIIYVS